MPFLGSMMTTDPDELGMQGGAGGAPQYPPQAPAPTPDQPTPAGVGFWAGLGRTLGALGQGALYGGAMAFEPGRQIMAQAQQQQRQQEAMAMQKRQQDQEGMQQLAGMMEKFGQLPPGPQKDFFGAQLAKMYQAQTGKEMDKDFLTMIKKQDEDATGATAEMVRELATTYGVNLQGFDTLIKSQPDKALALVLQRLNVEKTAMGMQQQREEAEMFKQLAPVGAPPGGQAPPPVQPGPVPPAPQALGAQANAAPPGSLGAQTQSAPPLPGPALAGGMAPPAQAVLPPSMALPSRPGVGQTPGVDLARREFLVGRAQEMAPMAPRSEKIQKLYDNTMNEIKHIDEQANRKREEVHQAQTEKRAQESQAMDRERLAEEKKRTGMEAQRVILAKQSEQRQAVESGLRRQELQLNIAGLKRKADGTLNETEQRKWITETRGEVRQEKPYKDFQAVRGGYQTLQEGGNADTTAGDLAIVNGINRLFNPDSTVMLGEAKNVEDAQGTLQKLLNMPKKFFTGERLNPQYRTQLLNMGKALYTRWAANADQELNQIYGPLAQQLGIATDRLYVSPLKALDEKAVGLNKKQQSDVDEVLKATGFK